MLLLLITLTSRHGQYCISVEGGYLLVYLFVLAAVIDSTGKRVRYLVLQPKILVDGEVMRGERHTKRHA